MKKIPVTDSSSPVEGSISTESKSSTVNRLSNVDADYNKQIKQFAQEQRKLPIKRKKLKKMEETYESLKSKDKSEMTDDELTQFHNLKTEIRDLSTEIEQTEHLSTETNFYLKTGSLLIDYYEKIEHVPDRTKQTSLSDDMSSTTKSTTQRKDLYQQYLAYTDPHFVNSVEYTSRDDYCDKCKVYREVVPNEALLVCPRCGGEISTIMESDKPSYHDPPHESTYFAYKRINHLKEQLAHFQAKETTKVPQEIYDVILIELKKEKKSNLAKLTRTQVKKYSQKYTHLGYNKYYENINQIICHLNGIQPFVMKPEVEEQLYIMFQKIQEPFEKYCPQGRTNFLSYSYVIYKCCQILGYIEYLPYFSILKSRDKVRQQDKIWKNICNDLGWPFYPTEY
jgi:hypothetical protein